MLDSYTPAARQNLMPFGPNDTERSANRLRIPTRSVARGPCCAGNDTCRLADWITSSYRNDVNWVVAGHYTLQLSLNRRKHPCFLVPFSSTQLRRRPVCIFSANKKWAEITAIAPLILEEMRKHFVGQLTKHGERGLWALLCRATISESPLLPEQIS